MSKELVVDYLGRVDYGAAWDLQKALVAALEDGAETVDKLLLLEHPPTYTLGRHANEANLLLDEEARAEKGIVLYHVDRGGDITYHGPGQLVGYPILNLEHLYGRGIGRIRRYVSDLETMLIRTLAGFGIKARLFEGFRGVWVEEDGELNKIAAIGVYVNRKGISSHGFALNVHTDLTYFDGIVPCGIDDHGVTSMSRLLAREVTIMEVLPRLTESFAAVFDFDLRTLEITHDHY
jgi:lipoyl(octanoyl) transferase